MTTPPNPAVFDTRPQLNFNAEILLRAQDVRVLLLDVDASAADALGVIIARHAICADNALIWPEGITGPQKATAITQLKDLGILVREGA